MVTEVQIKLIF